MKSTQKLKKATKTGKDKRTERDRFAVVLESIQTDFQIFGEKLEFLDEKVERGFKELESVNKRFDFLDEKVEKGFVSINKRVDLLDEKVGFLDEKVGFLDEKVERGFQKTNLKLEEIEFELNAIKIEIQTLRDTRFQKADFKKLEILEKRVFVLEKAIGRV